MQNLFSGTYGIVIIYALFFIGIYFLLIRPNKKKAQKSKEMRESVKKGDTIITIGGFEGKVEKVTDVDLIVNVNGTSLKVKKWAIGSVNKKDEVNV